MNERLHVSKSEMSPQSIVDQLTSSVITGADKYHLLELAQGSRSVCEISLYSPIHDQATIDEIEMAIKQIQDFATNNNLLYSAPETECDESDYYRTITVGYNHQLIAALNENTSDSEEYDTTRGTLFQIPQTAFAAWERRNKDPQAIISTEELPQTVRESGVLRFLDFHLSRDHWEKEIQVAYDRMESTKQQDPRLYEEIMQTERN